MLKSGALELARPNNIMEKMEELMLRKVLANLTEGSDLWRALDQVLTEAKTNATIVAVDVGVRGEDRVWQCGYAAALTDLHRTLNDYRKG